VGRFAGADTSMWLVGNERRGRGAPRDSPACLARRTRVLRSVLALLRYSVLLAVVDVAFGQLALEREDVL